MKTLIILALLSLHILSAYGQKKQLSIEIDNAKEQNIVFDNISSSFREVNTLSNDTFLINNFINPNEVQLFEYTPVNTRAISHGINFNIPINKKNIELELIEVPDFFYNYRVVTNTGETFNANRNIKHYRGIIKGDTASLVALTFEENEVKGFISNNDGVFNLGLNPIVGKHMLYNSKNSYSAKTFDCGTIDDFSEVYDSAILSQEYRASNVTNSYKYVRLFLETEFDIFQERESISRVESLIISIFNQVAAIYQNEGILISLSELFVWTTDDPYTGNTTDALLTQYQNRKTSINGDLGQLLTFRDVGGGRAGGFTGLHSNNIKDKLSVAMLYNSFSNYPEYSWSVLVMAHEFGHLFGSYHTHACAWNGNNTAIDGCVEPENNACSRPPIPANGGTIMSYCHQQAVGINFNLGFGLQPGNVIRNSVATSTSLNSIIISGPELVTTIGKTYTLNNATASSWSCSSNLQIISTTSNTIVVKSIGDGLGWIKATINTGVVKPTITHEVWSGKPKISRIDGPNRTPNGQYATFRAIYDYKSSPTSFEWILNPVNGNSVYGANTSVLDVAFYNTGSYQLVIRAGNECGIGEYFTSGVNVYNTNGRSYMAYPSPANQTLFVDFSSIENQKVQPLNTTAEKRAKTYNVRLFNIQGSMVRTVQSTGERISMDVSGLPSGNYILHIYDGIEKEPVTQKVVINH